MAAPQLQGIPGTRQLAAATTITADSPAGIVAGEVLIWHLRLASGNTAVSLTSTGAWTLEESRVPGASGANFVLSKLADSTDVANAAATNYYTVTADSSFTSMSKIFRVSGAEYPLPASEQGSASFSVATCSLARVTTTGPDRLILYMAGTNGTLTFTWDVPTEFYEEALLNRSVAGAWETQAAAGLSPQRVVTQSAQNGGQAITITLAPAPPTVELAGGMAVEGASGGAVEVSKLAVGSMAVDAATSGIAQASKLLAGSVAAEAALEGAPAVSKLLSAQMATEEAFSGSLNVGAAAAKSFLWSPYRTLHKLTSR